MLLEAVPLLHGDLLLQRLLHLLNDMISLVLSRVHDLCSHLVIDHHFVHFIVEDLHLVGHGRCVEVYHLGAGGLGEVGEGVHENFVVFHGFYLAAHKLHLHSSALTVLG